MPIPDWPAEERPREKLLARGAGALSEVELLAICLRCGDRGRTAIDLARGFWTLAQEFLGNMVTLTFAEGLQN